MTKAVLRRESIEPTLSVISMACNCPGERGIFRGEMGVVGDGW